MESRPKRQPTDKSEPFLVEKITLLPKEERPAGRPRNLEVPVIDLGFNEDEKQIYEFFIVVVKKIFGKDLNELDLLILPLAAAEYVKYLRLAKYEITKNTSITMARQHPGVQMRSLIDMMSISRKARQGTKKEDDDEGAKILKALAG